MKKVYEINRYYIEDDDDYSKYLGSLVNQLRREGLKDLALTTYKSICNQLRDNLNTENLLLLATDDNGDLIIIEFDYKTDNEVHTRYYEEGKGYYIEI